ncbi:MAG: L-serine ammonia-lyase [Fretibacterium sp.]|nr:L-serine ammonia-lyase [Fretibacterium sp.]
MQSVFDIFKIGIGPSSSHTVGPMKIGFQFTNELRDLGLLEKVERLEVNLYGSLALTGKGHHTDRAVLLGLAGNLPETVDLDGIPAFLEAVARDRHLPLGPEEYGVVFDPEGDMKFHSENLPLHENGMELRALLEGGGQHRNVYYSIGGGFVVDEAHFGQDSREMSGIPYTFSSAEELMQQCRRMGYSISTLVLENELALHSRAEIDSHFEEVARVMSESMQRGMSTEGILPGPLRLMRRAAPLHRLLSASEPLSGDPMRIVDWVNLFALAVSEENAAGGRVVTAPTNGACGVVPAVLRYYEQFISPLTPELRQRYFLTAGAIALLYRMNASISGAEVGCQGEVGVACSMAAAALAELKGGSPAQVCGAAEIAMEHNLGLTCDPVAGLVQVPCIERNAIAAVKAINAARMALRRTTPPVITLDEVITTMYETGKDMSAKYRETSKGGLARVVRCE